MFSLRLEAGVPDCSGFLNPESTGGGGGEGCWQAEPTLPLQANERQSACYSGNHSSRVLLALCQINELSHSLELLILPESMK